MIIYKSTWDLQARRINSTLLNLSSLVPNCTSISQYFSTEFKFYECNLSVDYRFISLNDNLVRLYAFDYY